MAKLHPLAQMLSLANSLGKDTVFGKVDLHVELTLYSKVVLP